MSVKYGIPPGTNGVSGKSGQTGKWTASPVVLGVILSLLAAPLQAGELWDRLGKRWNDPLLTRPPVLDAGAVLPGDSRPAPCAELDTINTINTNSTNTATNINTATLSLAQAVDTALCHNPQVQSAWAAIKQQAAALGEARAAYLPTASMSASRTKDKTWLPNSDLPGSAILGNSVYANLSWRLFDFGTRQANRYAANALLDAALANHDAVLQKTLAGVIQAYFDVQTAHAAWVARQTNEALARQTLEAAQRRESKGAGAQSDTLQARTALAKASLDRSRAQGAFAKAQSVLVYVLGVAANTRLELAEELESGLDTNTNASLRRDLDSWLEQAQTQHPSIVAARAQLAAADAKVLATRAEGRPTLDVTSSFYQNGRPNQGLPTVKTRESMVGVTLTIPLFEGFARTYKLRGAQAQAEQKQAELQDTEHQVLMELVKAHADAASALEELEASRQLLEAAQAALATVQRKFDRGAADILEILSTQAAVSDAQQERIRGLADWRGARLRLVASAGGLGRLGVAE